MAPALVLIPARSGEASKPAMRQLRDHLANAKDHIARIDAEVRGDHKAARLIRRRIQLRDRAMAVRMGGVKRAVAQ